MRLVFAGLRKLRTRTASWVALIVASILVVLEFLAIGVSVSMPSQTSGLDPETADWLLTFPSAFDPIMSMIYVFGGLVALIYVAAVTGTEWSWGTLKTAIVRGESRTRYTVATFGSISLVLLVGILVTFAAGVLGVVVGASIARLPIDGLTDLSALPHLAAILLRSWIALCCLCSLGYAIAMVARNQMAGVGAVIGVFIASVFVPGAPLPDVVAEILKYLPFSVASDAIGINGPPSSGGSVNAVEPNLALLVTIAWLIGSLAVAALATERAEING